MAGVRPASAATVLVLLLVLASSAGAPMAAAQSSAGCQITVGNDAVGSGTITVDKDASVTVSGKAEPFTTAQMFLNFAGARAKIGEATAGADGSWTKTVDVPKYAKWGVGLYRVDWKQIAPGAAAGTTKEATCTADVKVEGNFFGSRVSWVSTAVLAMGAAGLLLTLSTTLSIYRGSNAKWELKARVKAKAEKDEETGKVKLKVSYAFTQTLLSTLWGLLAGGASFATVVGTAASPPTLTLALSVTMPLTVAGLFLSQLKLWMLTQTARAQRLRRPAPEPAPA